MVKSCNVESCARVNMLQWVIGVAVTVMVSLQGYLVYKIDTLDDKVDIQNQSLVQRVTANEHEIKFLAKRLP